VAWVGSVALTEALGDAACGCDLIERAEQETDPRAAAVLRADGEACQREWGCPRVCAGPVALDAVHRDALDRATRLFDAEPGELTACPGVYARRPEAHRIVKALRWHRSGQLALIDPHPTGALVDALDLVQSGLAARERDELERARQKAPKGGDHGQGTR
jgi:hypothetical protein